MLRAGPHASAATRARGDAHPLTDVKPLVSVIYQDRPVLDTHSDPHIRGVMHTGMPDRRMDRGVC
jgi:hypothetical protein